MQNIWLGQRTAEIWSCWRTVLKQRSVSSRYSRNLELLANHVETEFCQLELRAAEKKKCFAFVQHVTALRIWESTHLVPECGES